MPLPSRKQQIEAVVKFLDSDHNEGRSLEEIAADVVDGFWDTVTPPAPALPLREGILIKTMLSNKAHRVAWIGGEKVWVVSETGGYGWLGPLDSDLWRYVEEYRPKRRVEVGVPCGSAGTEGHVCEPSHTIKGKMVEMTDEMIAEAWSNPDWSVGDQVSQHQREHLFEVIATGPQCVLLRNARTGTLCADSNSNLAKYYRREVKGGNEW